MSWITVIWSAESGACFMLALLHLLVWCRDRRSWANLCFCVMALGVIGMAMGEMGTMQAVSPAAFGWAGRMTHLAYAFVVVGSLGFVHFHFRTGTAWLLVLAISARVLALVANFTTGENLHTGAVHSLMKMPFLGEQVSILGQWEPNPWVRVGQIAALVQLAYVVDASFRLWRTGLTEARRRVWLIGGPLIFFIILTPLQAGLVASGLLRMPFFVSLPFLGMMLVMGYELSREVLRAAQLARDLRESEERMTLAAAAANLGVWIHDLVRNEIWATEKWRALFGFTASEPLRIEQVLQHVHPDDREVVRQVRMQAIEGRSSYEMEYRAVPAEGQIRWIASRGAVEVDSTGKPLLVRSVSIDITERKHSEQEAASHRNELAHLSRVSILGELAGAIAHELNQPLAAMLSNAQVGRRSLDARPLDLIELAAILDDITDDAKRAGGIIHGMRAMFRKDTALEAQPVDLNEAVRQSVSLLHSEIVSRKMNIELHLQAALPLVNAGRVGIQQVLINLILNSLDAMKKRECEGVSCIEITTATQGDQVMLSVRDQGPGIPIEMLGRLFEPFASTKPSGLGLGLAISRSIAERFGGELVAENHPESGAVFRLVLPLAE